MSMKKSLRFIAILEASKGVLVLLAGIGTSARAADISQLAWLGGCWKSETAEPGSGEHWLPLAGGTLLGVSRTVKQGKTVEFEFMQVRALENCALDVLFRDDFLRLIQTHSHIASKLSLELARMMGERLRRTVNNFVL